MNITAMYFSPTGTVKSVVTEIAKGTNLPYTVHDFTLPSGRTNEFLFSNDDLVIIGTPVYAGRVPNVLLPFLKTVKANGALCVPIVVYGNRHYDDALAELQGIMTDNGFRPIAAAAFVGQHSFSKVLAAGRPDKDDLDIAYSLGTRLLRYAASGKILPNTSGNYPPKPYYQPKGSENKPISILKVKPKTDLSLCDKCGICADICPMGSISHENPEIINGICIKCCACERKCPKGAKYFDDEGYLYHKHELETRFTRRADVKIFEINETE